MTMTGTRRYGAGGQSSLLAILALFGATACAGREPVPVAPRTVGLSWERRAASACPPDVCDDSGTIVDLVVVGASCAPIRAAQTTGHCEVERPPSNAGDLVSELRCEGPHDDDRVIVQVLRRAAGELVVLELRTEVADGPQPTRRRELGRIAIASEARVIVTDRSPAR